MFGSFIASGFSRVLFSYIDPDDATVEEFIDYGMNNKITCLKVIFNLRAYCGSKVFKLEICRNRRKTEV